MATYRRRRAACPQGPTYCTYWVRVPASGVGYVQRTVATQVEGEGILALQSLLFANLAGAHILVLRIIQELWISSGGVFNVDDVLQQMALGLEEELDARMNERMASPSVGSGGPED